MCNVNRYLEQIDVPSSNPRYCTISCDDELKAQKMINIMWLNTILNNRLFSILEKLIIYRYT